ncbi:MAG: ABC transporter substrate-binding protein, partial [Acidimicrobiales bacterium]
MTRRQLRWCALFAALLLLLSACGRDDDNGDGGGDNGDDVAAGDNGEDNGDGGGDGGDVDGGGSVDPDPGITDDSVKLGASYPLSGNASAYSVISNGAEACFEAINDAGGVEMGDGVTRTIEYEILDDAYDPARATQNAQRLVEQE